MTGPDASIMEWVTDGAAIRFHTPNAILRQLAESAATSEPETLDWLRAARPGETLFDVGASNGIYTIFAAIVPRLRVIAFEAEAQNYATLEMNLHLNQAALTIRPRAYCIAASRAAGSQDIYCARYEAGYHMKILGRPVRVGETSEFRPDHVQSVLTIALDDAVARFGLPAPNLLKIDVDGSEEDVIVGASALLETPALRSALVELVEPAGRSAQIVARLAKAGLRLAAAHPVRHLRGGFYEGLFNCIFEREGA
ncbi:MAG TPA: FkbM family methyltransferase [Stellaceae bacterium]|nr:FkbM family methyltransferase [Stellaceae bacterium]